MASLLSLFSIEREEFEVADGCEGHIGRPRPVNIMARAHRHNDLELNLALSGTATYLLNDRKYHLRRNSLLWLFPGQDHIFVDRSADYEMWIVLYRPELIARVCTSNDARILAEPDPDGLYARQLGDEDAQELSRHFERNRSFEPDPFLFNTALGYGLLWAWRLYQSADPTAGGGSLHPAVEAALRLMRREPEPVSIPEIAQQVGLSQPHLSRIFRAQTGLSLIEFRNRVRIERFRALYGRGNDLSMLTAALEAGFGSYPQFHRVFREVVGVSPQAHYRTQQPKK